MDVHEVEVGSLYDLQKAVWREDHSSDLHIVLKESISLHDAQKLWSYVSTTSGHGVLKNIEMLRGKREALLFVEQKLGELQSRVGKASMEIGLLTNQITQLNRRLAGEHRHLPRSYEPLMLDGPTTYLDPDQEVEVTEEEIEEMQAMYTPLSPYSAGRDEDYWTEEACTSRQQRELRALDAFNLAYLMAKRDALIASKDELQRDYMDIGVKYLRQPTALGSGSAEMFHYTNV